MPSGKAHGKKRIGILFGWLSFKTIRELLLRPLCYFDPRFWRHYILRRCQKILKVLSLPTPVLDQLSLGFLFGWIRGRQKKTNMFLALIEWPANKLWTNRSLVNGFPLIFPLPPVQIAMEPISGGSIIKEVSLPGPVSQVP